MFNQYQMQIFLNKTLESLRKHGLNPIPDNYKVWYEYSCSSNNQLNDEIDQLIAQQIAISEEICHKLLKKYFVSDDQKDFDAARLAFSHLLNIMISQISNWTDNSDDFCSALEKCTSRLNADPSIHEIKDIITELTNETLAMSSVSSDINTMLGSLTSEVEQLRRDLEQAGNEAITDSLTGISNRRGLDERLSCAIEEANSQGTEFSIIMIDIDHFKNINDKFGHATGDKILKLVATIMQKKLRAKDFIARFGGEEFTIILPDTNLEGAIQVAEHMRKAVSAKQLSASKGGQVIGRITVSVGVTQYRQLDNMEELLDRGDRCMYEAKHLGRNNVKSDDDIYVRGK